MENLALNLAWSALNLLKELDNPQDKFKSVHVTGTNGKGSVSSMIANILLAGNLKTGKFISPHLVKYNERISINNNDITDEAFALVISAVKQAADSIVAKGVWTALLPRACANSPLSLKF